MANERKKWSETDKKNEKKNQVNIVVYLVRQRKRWSFPIYLIMKQYFVRNVGNKSTPQTHETTAYNHTVLLLENLGQS